MNCPTAAEQPSLLNAADVERVEREERVYDSVLFLEIIILCCPSWVIRGVFRSG